jgi:hypothetical protein
MFRPIVRRGNKPAGGHCRNHARVGAHSILSFLSCLATPQSFDVLCTVYDSADTTQNPWMPTSCLSFIVFASITREACVESANRAQGCSGVVHSLSPKSQYHLRVPTSRILFLQGTVGVLRSTFAVHSAGFGKFQRFNYGSTKLLQSRSQPHSQSISR